MRVFTKYIYSVIVCFLTINQGFAQAPTISSFSPISDTIGATVTITGTNFNTNTLNNIVYFGPVKANVLSASNTALTVSVPGGATYSPITVSNIAFSQTASSRLLFTPTHNPYNDSILASSFTAASIFDGNTSYACDYLSIGDLNLDGKPDLVSSSYTPFAVLKNTSNLNTISFSPKRIFPVSIPTGGNGLNKSKLHDLDGDGKLDMIAHSGSQVIIIRRNNSTIDSLMFDNQVSLNTNNAYNYDDIVVQDLDGDAKPEIVYVSSSNAISIFKNTGGNGIISFNSATFNINSITAPKKISYGDIDGDGKAELIVTSANDSIISVLKNTSNISNFNFSTQIDFYLGYLPESFVVADIDGDNKLDIATANKNNSFSVLKNTTIGSVINFAPKQDFPTDSFVSDIKIGDINGDGKPDITTIHSYYFSFPATIRVNIYRNSSTTNNISFANKISILSPYTYATVLSNIWDLNGDAKPEILLTQNGNSSFTYYKNNPIILSKNANLSNIVLSNGNLSQSFNKDTIIYTANVSNAAVSLSITPFKMDSFSVIQIKINNGIYSNVNSGTLSSALSLNIGLNTISIRVTAQNGTTIKIYTIKVFRALSTNANLLSLNLIGIPYLPAFHTDTLTYSANVLFGVNNVRVSFILSDTSARIKIKMNNGVFANINNRDTSGILPLNVGLNTIFIKVTAQDTLVTRTFLMNVTRATDIPPSAMIYSPASILATRIITNINSAPTSSGGAITSFSISPSLPTGVSLNTSTGVITGIPAVKLLQTVFTITGTNSGGSTTASFTLTVNSIAPSKLKYTDSNRVATRTITNINSSVTYLGDSITAFSISPSLPIGVSLDTLTGKISGIPIVILPPTVFTVTGTNSGGSTTASFTLTVNSIAPSKLKYTDSNRVATRTITNINSSVTYLGDSITAFSISPSLPIGVSLDTLTGKISGIPIVILPPTVFAVTGTNSGGSTTASFTLTVNSIAPSKLKYIDSNIIATRTITNINSSVTYLGDSITSFSISPSLPTGVNLNTLTGKITGIPTVILPPTVFTITGTNSGGSTTASFTLTVNSIAPSKLKYTDSNIVATRTITNINSSVTYLGDSITTFSISPSLLAGVSLDTLTGKISGIPTVILPPTVFTITGINSGGSTSTSFTLTVNSIAPSKLKYTDSNIVAIRTITNINSSVTYLGDSIISFSITPSLPAGVDLNTTTGLISGIPSVNLPQTVFTITGTNSGGSTTATFTLIVNPAISISEVNANIFSNLNFKPNPFNNELEISFVSSSKEASKLVITDALGKEIYTKTIQSIIGDNNFMIDEAANFKAGIYFARLASENGFGQSFKLIKN